MVLFKSPVVLALLSIQRFLRLCPRWYWRFHYLFAKKEDQLLSQIDGVVRDTIMTLSPTGEDAGRTGKASLTEGSTDAFDGNLSEAISDAFEKHLPDPSVLVEPAKAYADAITEASVDKLSPLTQLVRDSVEGVSEARLACRSKAS